VDYSTGKSRVFTADISTKKHNTKNCSIALLYVILHYFLQLFCIFNHLFHKRKGRNYLPVFTKSGAG